MKISARNVLEGTVTAIERGAVNGYVTVKVEDKVEVVSMLALEAIDRLEIEIGSEVYTVIDAADVMVGVSHHKRE
jgi:molybdopterin-binding protein